MPQLIHFSDEAHADVRAIDRETALHILKAIARFMKSGAGDVLQLHGYDPPLHRLRIGPWRAIFRYLPAGEIEVLHVRHRSEVYR